MDPAAQGVIASRFRIVREVGRGAAGIVYRAADLFSGLEVALKIIASTGVEPAEHARFAREGQLLSELDHPGIVRVVAFGSLESSTLDAVGRRLEGSPYVAMERARGRRPAGAPAPPLRARQAPGVGRQIAGALAAAHARGSSTATSPQHLPLDGGGRPVPLSGPRRATAPLDPRQALDFGVAARTTCAPKTGAVVARPPT
jgi:serine/threonine protein kinase